MRITRLTLFEDQATGDYGLAPEGTDDDRYGNGFNAFWNGIGIFHDVFEHWFEGKHKYFHGNNYRNVAGEVAASGATLYYAREMTVANRSVTLTGSNTYMDDDSLIGNTHYIIQDAIGSGYMRFGNEFTTCIPYQKPGDIEIENLINEHWKKIQHERFDGVTYGISDQSEEQRLGKAYKDSLTLRKLRNAYRWGYYHAKRMIHDNWQNRSTLEDFIDFFNKFTKRWEAKELYEDFHTLEIHLHTGKNVRWKAYLITRNGQEKVSITQLEEYFDKQYSYE